MQSTRALCISEKNNNDNQGVTSFQINSIFNQLDQEEIIQLNARREKLSKEIEDGLEYVLQTIGSNERVTLPLIKYKSGSIYGGEWKNGKKDGKGRCLWLNGTVYVGDWEEDATSGWVQNIKDKGKLRHPDEDTYEGEWQKDKANGKGTYFRADGTKYEGDHDNDKSLGKGFDNWPDFGRYEGDYSEDKRHGEGFINFSDGSRYEGSFLQNDICGYGTYVWPDERVYIGEWRKNQMHGKGQLIWQDGKKYTGVKDKKHGRGVFEWKDGRKYIGNWIQGSQHSVVMYYLQNKEVKVGIWKVGKRVKWILNLFTFDEYILLKKPFAVFQNLQQKLYDVTLEEEEDQIYIRCNDNSNQKIILPPIKLLSGAIYEGEWRNAMKNGEGKILFPDRSFYEGQWENNMKHGWGKQIFKDGKVFEGEWLDDLPVYENQKQENIKIQKTDTIEFV